MAPTAKGREEGRIPHHQRCSRMKNDGSINMDKGKDLTSNTSLIRENKESRLNMAKPGTLPVKLATVLHTCY